MSRIRDSRKLTLQVVVTGAHLSERYGMTVYDIVNDGFSIDARVECLPVDEGHGAIAKVVGRAMPVYVDVFNKLSPDIIVVLGDRYELLPPVITAMLMKIPLAHIHGGEVTEGAVDEFIRHAITKMSSVHFAAADEYKDRLLQIGEMPDRVHMVGSPGVENINHTNFLTREELSRYLSFDLNNDFFLVSFHPETNAMSSDIKVVEEMLSAIDEFPEYNVLITYPNSDENNAVIIHKLVEYAESSRGRVLLVKSLGSQRYLSALKYAKALVGNSSSGLIEAPTLCTPAVNIGHRQDGRVRADSVIDCSGHKDAILEALRTACSAAFQNSCLNSVNPYGGGNTSKMIADVLEEVDVNTLRVKHFNDIPGLRDILL